MVLLLVTAAIDLRLTRLDMRPVHCRDKLDNPKHLVQIAEQ
ncbi:hypothetical protein [Bradyrhizobium sp. S69]|jgi:hypothetical protein|nr:hypothetical protein [Bradyrhizobium sp. S69]